MLRYCLLYLEVAPGLLAKKSRIYRTLNRLWLDWQYISKFVMPVYTVRLSLLQEHYCKQTIKIPCSYLLTYLFIHRYLRKLIVLHRMLDSKLLISPSTLDMCSQRCIKHAGIINYDKLTIITFSSRSIDSYTCTLVDTASLHWHDRSAAISPKLSNVISVFSSVSASLQYFLSILSSSVLTTVFIVCCHLKGKYVVI